ncbi:MAG TPA: DUF4190 domain-containing protein [Actinomycetospora sp.]|nr:DUF4190 domain-containing protein [Actinomycetospora sp.]
MTQQYQSPQPFNQYPGPYGPQPPYAPPSNGMATAGFVVALVGAVLALIPFLGIVAWLISPVGLVLSVVGTNMAARRQGSGRGLAVAGIVLGVVGLLICFLWASAFAAATSGSNTGTTYSAPSYSASAPTQSAADESATTPAGSFGQGTYTVGSEIAPGRYRTDGAPESSLFPLCMAARQGADGSPIGFPETTNNGPAYITVRASDGLVEFTGDCTWAPAS